MTVTRRELKSGDWVFTDQIAPNWGQNKTKAQIRKIKGDEANVIYGMHLDRAWVSLSSCEFIEEGTLYGMDFNDTHAGMGG